MKHRTYVVGLTGASGAGKTTFINQIRAAFNDADICLVSQDNYYRPKDQQKKDEKGMQCQSGPKGPFLWGLRPQTPIWLAFGLQMDPQGPKVIQEFNRSPYMTD